MTTSEWLLLGIVTFILIDFAAGRVIDFLNEISPGEHTQCRGSEINNSDKAQSPKGRLSNCFDTFHCEKADDYMGQTRSPNHECCGDTKKVERVPRARSVLSKTQVDRNLINFF